MRDLPHRLPGPHTLRPPLQAARLYGRRRHVPHDSVPSVCGECARPGRQDGPLPQGPRGRRKRRQGLRSAGLDDGDHRLHPYAGTAAAADRSVQAQRQCRAFAVQRLLGRCHYGQHRRLRPGHLWGPAGGRIHRSVRPHLGVGQHRCPFGQDDDHRRRGRDPRHHRQQQSLRSRTCGTPPRPGPSPTPHPPSPEPPPAARSSRALSRPMSAASASTPTSTTCFIWRRPSIGRSISGRRTRSASIPTTRPG